MMLDRKGFIYALYRNRAVKFGPHTLSSGRTSDWFCDVEMVMYDPTILSFIIDEFDGFEEEETLDSSYDKVVGIARGGIPLITAISAYYGMPYVLVDHDCTRLVSGSVAVGEKLLLVDDVMSTGLALEKAIGLLRSMGGNVQAVYVAVNRDEGAVEKLQELGIDKRMWIVTGKDVLEKGRRYEQNKDG